MTARLTSSSVTVILFFSPISDSTRPSRTRRSAILWYSSLAASSVVSSSANVLPPDSISALIEFRHKPLARRFLELVERFEPEGLGELIVDRSLLRRLDQRRGGLKLGRLAGELLAGVVLRKRNFQDAGFARRDAEQLFFETGNEGV